MKVWTEPEVRNLLCVHGIDSGRFETAGTVDEAAVKADILGYPVALKVVSRDVVHKTEVGGVKLDLGSPSEVRQAFRDIMNSCERYDAGARIEGVIITPMCKEGVEMIAGLVRDGQFGPVLMVGLGGVFVEVFEDVSFRVAPVTVKETLEMLRELKGYRLLRGFRGRPPADIGALARLLARLSNLPFEYTVEEIRELDLNPVRVLDEGRGVVVLDARMVTGGARQ